MADERRPVLLFPKAIAAVRAKGSGGASKFRFPSKLRQEERLGATISALERSLEERRVFLSDSALGGEPEGVLVLEVAGSLDKFHKAVKAVGIEWLGEYDEDEIEPDDDFKVVKKRNQEGDEPDIEEETPNRVPRHVFLTATNQQSLSQFLAMWKQWLKGEAFKHRQTKWARLFQMLRTVRFWNAEDRVRATGLWEVWQRAVAEDRDPEPFAVELWYRDDASKQQEAERSVRKFVGQSGGQVIGRPTLIPGIAYHALIVSLPKQRVVELLNDVNSVELAKCDQVMLLRPTGQVAGGPTTQAPPLQDIQQLTSNRVRQADMPAPDAPPEIAILDGLPAANHEALDGRLDVDDPDDWGSEYPVEARKHGTMVASNVIHGDLGAVSQPLARRIYIRPIMRPRGDDAQEFIPPDLNEIDLVHSAVTRAMELHPTLKVFLLAVCDPVQVFSGRISPWARLIDYLTHKHNILFVISSGNHNGSLHFDVGTKQLLDMVPGDRDRLTVSNVLSNAVTRGVMAPADSINAITVGAVNQDASELDSGPEGTVLPVSARHLPAPFSAIGPGYRRSVKPDFITHGGRKPYRPMLHSPTETRLELPHSMSIHPGIVTAVLHQTYPYRFSAGTTLAAALTARRLAQALEYLRDPQLSAPIPDEFLPVLAKALVTHTARWDPQACETIDAARQDLPKPLKLRAAATRILGYGYVPPEGTFDCAAHRATCIGFGAIEVEKGHQFNLPLPPVLSNVRWRRLTVTMAYLSPIKPTVQAYRKVVCWADRVIPNNVRFNIKTVDVEVKPAQNGTLQHLVFEGNDAPVFTDGDTLQLIVSSRPGAYDGKKADGTVPTRYGLVVSLEVAENINIYDEVRDRIRPRVRIEDRLARR